MNKMYWIKDQNPVSIYESESCNITIVIDCEIANIDYQLSQGDYNILVYRKSNEVVKLNEKGFIADDTTCHIAYLDLGTNELSQGSNFEVNHHSTLNIDSIYLGSKNKKIKYDINNLKSHSVVNINNSVVALKENDLTLDVIGTIKKGAKQSVHHQSSRCLTIDKLNKVLIRPVLNIDENDVQASHSMSSGTIDEAILYYMNARGLSRSQALLLMIESYLSFESEFYQQFDSGEEIEKEAKEKVSELCLI